MPEPFKNNFNPKVINDLANALKSVLPEFDAKGFEAAATHKLDALELKERSNQIAEALVTHLPSDFSTASAALIAKLKPLDAPEDAPGLSSWVIMPMADYVARVGLPHFDAAMDVLTKLTSRFSSEFAVRPFLAADLERALTHVRRWAADPNEHIRRLASEGTRPYLPWGMHLPQIAANPDPVLDILTTLRDDPSEYVRRSVANCLNDFARDHPDRVAALCAAWMPNASKNREKLIRHALRSLIKAGHPGALAALGYGPPKLDATLSVTPGELKLGEALSLTAKLTSTSPRSQKLVIDFALHLMKKNGKLTPKVFKWITLELAPGETRTASKTHAIKPVTTRVYYPGAQKVELQINGQSFGTCDFALTMTDQTE